MRHLTRSLDANLPITKLSQPNELFGRLLLKLNRKLLQFSFIMSSYEKSLLQSRRSYNSK